LAQDTSPKSFILHQDILEIIPNDTCFPFGITIGYETFYQSAHNKK
jgi:hypothetical protein